MPGNIDSTATSIKQELLEHPGSARGRASGTHSDEQSPRLCVFVNLTLRGTVAQGLSEGTLSILLRCDLAVPGYWSRFDRSVCERYSPRVDQMKMEAVSPKIR